MKLCQVFTEPPHASSITERGAPNGYSGFWATWYFPDRQSYQGGLTLLIYPDHRANLCLWQKGKEALFLDLTDENKVKAWKWYLDKQHDCFLESIRANKPQIDEYQIRHPNGSICRISEYQIIAETNSFVCVNYYGISPHNAQLIWINKADIMRCLDNNLYWTREEQAAALNKR